MRQREIVQLQSVATIVQGGRHKLTGNDFVSQGGYPAYGAGGINGHLPVAEFDREAVVLSSIGARCGKCFLAKGLWSSLANTQVILPDEKKVDSTFLWYQLNDEKRWPRAGVAQPFIKPSDVKAHKIILPPLEEQKRIAAILDQADDIRRKRQHAIERLNQLGQAIFHEMFGDLLLSNDGTAKLGDVCDVRDGTHDSPKYVDEGHPLLTSKNFSAGSIDYNGSNRISDRDYALINKRSKVDKGDIVMPMIGTIGSPVIVDFDPDFAIKNVALIKFKNGLMNQEFVRQVLDGALFKSHVASKGRGGTQKFISLGDIRDFKIPFPSIDRQNAFAEIMRRLRAEVVRNMGVKHRTDSLFASLQHRAFTGQL